MEYMRRYEMKNKKTIISRRDKFYRGANGALDKDDYIVRIEAHYRTLKKYIDQFGQYLDFYISYSWYYGRLSYGRR